MTATAVAQGPAVRSEQRTHQPALDGVRGLSVLVVLLFHAGAGWMSGGYVGVSVFFTLSGFLITRLLFDEHDAHGRIDVARFWRRRARRLLPAGLVCLGTVAVSAQLGAFGNVDALGGDLLAALFQVANWHALFGDTSYAQQVFGGSSPLDHVWSLSIEEQFYWVWPLVMVVVMRRSRPHRHILGLAAVAAVAAPGIARLFGPDAAYWATPARSGEILVGAVLAAMLHRRRERLPRAVASAGVPALAVIIWAAVTWPRDRGPAYDGWLPMFAVASAVLILSLQVRSPLRRVLSWRPLVGLGTISYGVYLYHWPIFMIVDGRLGMGRAAQLVVEFVCTVAAAAASYRWIEQPIRRGTGSRRQLLQGMLAATVGVAVLATFGTFGRPDRFADPSSAVRQLEPVGVLAPLETITGPPVSAVVGRDSAEPSSLPALPRPGGPPSPPAGSRLAPDVAVPDMTTPRVPQRPVRILVVGDSTAWSTGDGLAAWAEANPAIASVALTVSPGCGFILSGMVPDDGGAAYAAQCETTLNEWMNDALHELRPDVVMLMATRTDVKDREWSADEGALTIFDPTFRRRALSDYIDLTDWILGAGVADVVWIKPPLVRVDPAPPDEMTDPARMQLLYSVIDETVGGSDPDRVTSVDLASWYASSGMTDDEVRVDGMHFEIDGATEIARRFLGPALVNIALDG